MNTTPWTELIGRLRTRGITFDDGLSDAEVHAIQTRFGFTFPEDLRAFLQTALPVALDTNRPNYRPFPDWRCESEKQLRGRLEEPLEGLLFDLKQNDIWMPSWGDRPRELKDACRHLHKLVASAPTLIPIFAHRMMPDRPTTVGNPVYSVHQTDIIYYGLDLHDYLMHEFFPSEWTPPDADVRAIEFWDIEELQDTRWPGDGSGVVFDNRDGKLPQGLSLR